MRSDTLVTGFEDESTVIEVREEELVLSPAKQEPAEDPAEVLEPAAVLELAQPLVEVEPLLEPLPMEPADALLEHAPPALPFPLALPRTEPTVEEWMAELPEASRAVLERARVVAPRWPFAKRVPGAVATPAEDRPRNN